MGRRARSRRGGALLAGWLAVAAVVGVGLGHAAAPVAGACVAAPVPFQRIVDHAPVIFFVTVASRATSGGAPTAYTLVVREAFRGDPPNDAAVLPTVIRLAAPPVSACGDVLDVPISSHLVLALDVPVFDDGEPLAVAWVLRPDGSLVGEHDDGLARWVDMDALRTALAGGAIPTSEPSAIQPATPASTLDDEPPIASLGILIGLIAGVIAVAALLMIGRRGRRVAPLGEPDPPGP